MFKNSVSRAYPALENNKYITCTVYNFTEKSLFSYLYISDSAKKNSERLSIKVKSAREYGWLQMSRIWQTVLFYFYVDGASLARAVMVLVFCG